MNESDNNYFLTCWQVVLILSVIIGGSLIFCAYAADIRITTTPPRTVPAPAPTATLSPLYVILTEQAKASAKVQVITAETDNEIRLRWNIHYMRRWWAYLAVPVGFIFIGLGIGYLGVRYGRK